MSEQRQPKTHNWSTPQSAERTRFHRKLFLQGRLGEVCDSIRATGEPIPSLLLERLGYARDQPEEPPDDDVDDEDE